jgi:hypothetical protein
VGNAPGVALGWHVSVPPGRRTDAQPRACRNSKAHACVGGDRSGVEMGHAQEPFPRIAGGAKFAGAGGERKPMAILLKVCLAYSRQTSGQSRRWELGGRKG